MGQKIRDTETASIGRVLTLAARNFCIGFTILMLFSMVFGMLFASEESKSGILYCWGMAVTVICAVVLQCIFFTPFIIKRSSYATRLVLFGVCLYLLLLLCGALFHWFPWDIRVWVSFTVVYLLILVIMALIFSLIYKRDIQALNKSLDEFKLKSKEAE